MKNAEIDAIHFTIGAIVWLVASIKGDVMWYLYDGDYIVVLIAGVGIIYQFILFPYMSFKLLQKYLKRKTQHFGEL